MLNRFRNFLLVMMTICYAQSGWAAAKSLVELSKSKKKIKDGEYEFVLDTTKEVKKGTPVSADIVKSALESKLGASLGVKVTAKGKDAVTVTYNGDEAKFLEQVGKTKIRAGGDVELALESSGSDGGIRASKLDRKAAPDEVKAIVLKADKDTITVKVTESNNSKVKNGATLKVKAGQTVKVKDNVFFVPEKEEAGIWLPKAGSFQAPAK